MTWYMPSDDVTWACTRDYQQ